MQKYSKETQHVQMETAVIPVLSEGLSVLANFDNRKIVLSNQNLSGFSSYLILVSLLSKINSEPKLVSNPYACHLWRKA